MGEHGQGDVAVPAWIASDLVVVESDLALGGLEGFLDRPADPGDPGELTQRGPRRAGGQVVGDVGGVGEAAPGEQPVAGPGQRPDRRAGPLIDPRAFAPAPTEIVVQACGARAATAASIRPAPAPAGMTYWLLGTAST